MDCVIGCSTNYDWAKIKYWVNSINESGFTGDKVMILMNCDKDTVQKVSDAGFDIIAFNQDTKGNLVYNSNMMVHVERFYHIYQHLKNKEYRYVITTDVKDVIFQKNPSEWLEEWLGNDSASDDLVFSSESMKYKDEPWGDQNLRETFGTQIYEDFKDNTIYNVGVLAGRGYAMKDLCMNIFTSCLGRPIKICDQSTFNFLISQHPYLKTSKYAQSEDGWACQLGTTADPSKIEQFKPFLLEPSPKLDGDKVVTSTGIEYTIVHQYDRVPEWRKVIEEKYNDK
jgi:hypothetical protein